MDTVKLQKYFTDCGVLSRRAAEDAIAKGLVRVNGSAAALGLRINPDTDKVEYNGQVIRPSAEERIVILLNKPRGYVTTLSDEKGRRTVAELTENVGRRVYPVGRLDMDSDGLLLLTDDGALANRLTHPRHEIPKIYRVTVKGRVTDAALHMLGQAMELDGYTILPVPTTLHSYDPNTDQSVLEMQLREGRNRQIRKMCQKAELRILRLCRIAIGELTLDKLPSGKWRKLTPEECAYLRGEQASL